MEQQSFIYKFLLAPQYRVLRYLALTIFFTIVSLNQALVSYKELIPQIGNAIYWIVAITILIYVVCVMGISKIASRYLLTGKYLWFLTYCFFCAILFVAVSNITYDLYMVDYDFFSEIVMVDNISAFALYVLCISGVAIPVFLKNWIVANQHLSQLKIKQASSQIEQFKEQINPPSFFKILGKSKDSVKTDPDKASTMLMKLSQLLRYQLYDCNREQVLLTAEISFLQNFLELEKLHSFNFNYTIKTEGDINGVFVSPSVILPYVQSVINVFDKEKEEHIVNIVITNTDKTIYTYLEISGISNSVLLQEELQKVEERLNMLYKDSYELIVNSNEPTGKTKIALRLYQK